MAAGDADPQVPAGLAAGSAAAAGRTDEALRPARGEQVIATGILGRKAILELQDRQRIRRPWHPSKLGFDPDGANRIRT